VRSAEQRLEHLTELFETGRWRRYHSELAFLENIQEAKTAVEIWRGLAAPRNMSTPLSTSRGSVTPIRHAEANELSDQPDRQSKPARIAGELPSHDVSIVPETNHVNSDEAPSAPALAEASALTLDTIEQRYPLLRNAL